MGDLQPSSCLIYLDDILVSSKSVPEHLQRLGRVFERLADTGLKLTPSKCCFFKKKVLYLGHVISAKGIQMDPGKTDALQSCQAPKTVREL